MKPEEWFRRTEWNSEIEAAFEGWLRRSRTAFHRAQYLRIQSLTLIDTKRADLTRVGMRLAHRVLAEYANVRSQISLCLHGLGYAHEQLGEFEDAISFYRKACEFEAGYRNVTSRVRLDLAMLIVRLERRADAEEALAAVESSGCEDGGLFMRDIMHRSLVRASIAAWRGDTIAAAAYARKGLEAARKTRSPMRYHPTLGLATSEDAAEIEALRRLAGE